MLTRVLAFAAAVTAFTASPDPRSTGQAPAASPAGPAAFLFEYRLPAGMKGRFEEGYRRHLDWHRRHQDPLPWYAWSVVTGERLDVFIDGTFGIPFAAFDQRVDPAADAADFDQTAGAFAVPLSRRVYRLRKELSTARPLEDRTPAPTVDVLHIVVKPGSTLQFEAALAALRTAADDGRAPAAYTCYSLVTGGELPAYLLMVVRDGWRSLDASPVSPFDRITGGRLDATVRQVVSETWSYRPDLSLLPGR